MFAIPGIVLLLLQGYIRPQEFMPSLQTVPFLYIFFGLALFSAAHRLPSETQTYATDLIIPITFYFVISQGVQSFRAFSAVAATLLVIVLFLAVVGVHQGLAPFGCFKLDPSAADASGTWDGRLCAKVEECEQGDVEPDASYVCEHVGLFDTSSVADGRVRYRGSLNDPNELALTLSAGLPFAFAFFERKRSFLRLLLLAASLALIGTCVIMTRSRGGQLVFLTVLAVYFTKRYGVRGLILAAIVAAPLLLVGTGERGDAEASSEERIEMMNQAIRLFFWFPLRGVGFEQILEYNPLTAHNSYALAAAELGLPGMVLWTSLLYLSLKILITILRRFGNDRDAAAARTWAVALLASLAGMSVGIFFLSFCYHIVFWIYVGLVGALWQACRAHDDDFEVRLDFGDLYRLVVIDLALVFVIWAYTTAKIK